MADALEDYTDLVPARPLAATAFHGTLSEGGKIWWLLAREGAADKEGEHRYAVELPINAAISGA